MNGATTFFETLHQNNQIQRNSESLKSRLFQCYEAHTLDS